MMVSYKSVRSISYLIIGLLLISFVSVLESSVTHGVVSENGMILKREVRQSNVKEDKKDIDTTNKNGSGSDTKLKGQSGSASRSTKKPDVGKTEDSDKVTPAPPNSKDHSTVGNVKEKDPQKNINCSLPENKNTTYCKPGFMTSIFRKMSGNSAMLFRTMLVLLGVTSIVIVYFIVRAVRLRRRRSKSRKYGVITRSGDAGDMEMEPLGDGNDDDEDYTVFEMNGRRK